MTRMTYQYAVLGDINNTILEYHNFNVGILMALHWFPYPSYILKKKYVFWHHTAQSHQMQTVCWDGQLL